MKTIPLFNVCMSQKVLDPVNDLLMSGYVGQGEKVEQFEDKLKDHFQTSYINTVNSATSGIHLLLSLAKRTFSNQHEVEVLTTPLTCSATNLPILANGLKIKWVDIDPNTCNLDLDDLERKLSPTTKVIILVHWGGYPVDLDRIESIKNKCYSMYGFVPIVIEDCAHAWGSTYRNKLVGTHGNHAVFSFQATKQLTTVDGGCVISPNVICNEQVKLARWYGLDRSENAKPREIQDIKSWGYKFHMNDLNAIIGINNFDKSLDSVKANQNNAKSYNGKLKNIVGIELLENKGDRESSCWLYTIKVSNNISFTKMMKDRGIQVSRVHRRNDTHSCMKEFRSPLPNLDKIYQNIVCVPCGWWLLEEEKEYIIDCIKQGW